MWLERYGLELIKGKVLTVSATHHLTNRVYFFGRSSCRLQYIDTNYSDNQSHLVDKRPKLYTFILIIFWEGKYYYLKKKSFMVRTLLEFYFIIMILLL